jgi:uncharacterized protein YqjF (DUF2071 family)
MFDCLVPDFRLYGERNKGPPTFQSAVPFRPEENPLTSGKRMAGQGLFSEKSVRMLGECEGRSGLLFSAHAPDASECPGRW